MKCFVAYYRVSTQKQGKSGLGLEAQKASVEGYVSSHGNISREFTEIESGRNCQRAELEKALRYCQRKGCTLIIAKLDRLSRNAAFLNQILDSGVEVCAVDMPTANRMVLGIMSQVAQHEAEMISKRTKEALTAAKARGKKLGANNPAWKRKNRKAALQALPKATANSIEKRTAAAQKHAEEMRSTLESMLKQQTSFREMAEALNISDEHHPPRGEQWQATQVRRVCVRLGLIG